MYRLTHGYDEGNREQGGGFRLYGVAGAQRTRRGARKSEIADNVRAIATKLGYRSNPLASSLRTGKTHILGFISEEVATTPYAGGMILGAQTAASQFGYMLITVSTDGENSESEEIAALKRYGTDGFLYAKMSNRITHAPSSLAKTPLVLVDATDSLGKIPSVEPDEFQIATTPPPDWLRPDAHVSPMWVVRNR